MKIRPALLAIVVLGSGCAKAPDQIAPAFVSPSTYAGASCRTIVAERNAVVRQTEALSGAQQQKATSDAVATGVALVLFWPAVFLVGQGQDHSTQLAQLKGSYEALTAAGQAKGCLG